MGSDVSLSKAVRANLLSLQNTASMMDKTQNRLATGNKVNSALDNPSNFFTAAALNSRAADMGNLLDSMASGIKVIEAANNGITALTKNLESMQSTLRQARQDKSFQTKSFDVTDKSVIKLAGGQFEAGTEIKLTDAVAGVKAQMTTNATTPYLGVVQSHSTAGSDTGVGARSVISLNGGFSAGDKFKVAGVEVELGVGAQDATSVAGKIQAALQGTTATANKYTVTVGAAGTDNAGKVIIETVDTSAAAAEVVLDIDGNPASGVDAAKSGTTTFKYADVGTLSIKAGGEDVARGANFAEFVTNLQAKAEKGGYSVTSNSTTGEVTLTATQPGGPVPDVQGVATQSAANIGTKTKVEFTLQEGTGGQVDKLKDAQTLTIGGKTVTLSAGMDNAQIAQAFRDNTDINDKYTVTVDSATLKVTLEAKLPTTELAPVVTTTQVATPAKPSISTVASGVDFVAASGGTGTTALAAMTGTIKLTSTVDPTDTKTYTLDSSSTTGALLTSLNDKGFTVEATTTGLKFSRNDGEEFNIEVTGGSNGQLGLGAAVTTVSNGVVAKDAGITGGTPASIAGTVGTLGTQVGIDALATAGTVITLDDGVQTPHSVTLTAGMTENQILDQLNKNGFEAAINAGGGLEVKRPDGTNFKITISGGTPDDLGFVGGASLTSTNGTKPTITGTPGVAPQAAVSGQVKVNPTAGASVATVKAEMDEFTVSYDGKTAKIGIVGVKGGVGSTAPNAVDIKNWQDATITSVNAQLEGAGITGVEAKFDANGKFQLVAKEAEAKTLAVSGEDSAALFGTDGVNTGKAAITGLNATKTVDKFVELINRDFGGKIRASNDNGKLRIENLSTQELDIGVDTNGNGAITPLKVEGNSVRANLSKQFNELRDQLDKLSDDASFNGINLLRGDKLKITFNESGTSSIDIQAKDKNGNVRGINASNLSIESLVAEDLDTDEGIDAFLGKLSAALTELRSQASSFGSNLSSVENRQSFTKNMINTLETGAANLTLADTNEEAANLLALQTRQQLSSSALSMASQQDQAVLQLLR